MQIEKDVPIPKVARANPGAKKYPFVDMEIGDSVLIEGASTTQDCRPYVAARVHGHKAGKKFAARKVDGGVRIWRIE